MSLDFEDEEEIFYVRGLEEIGVEDIGFLLVGIG